MMGHREQLKNGDEQDAFAVRGRWRRLLCVFQNKKRFSRRLRRAAKQERWQEC